jgi:stress-induced morphogen
LAITADHLRGLLVDGLPGADVQVVDLAGDGDHYRVVVIWTGFLGKSRLAQHQMVYAALGDTMKSTLHALAIETKIP